MTNTSRPHNHVQIWGLIIVILATMITVGLLVWFLFNIGKNNPSVQQKNKVVLELSSDKTTINNGEYANFSLKVTNNTGNDISYTSSSSCDPDSLEIDGRGRPMGCTEDIVQRSLKAGQSKTYNYTVTASSLNVGCVNIQGTWQNNKSNIIKLCKTGD